MYLYLIPLSFLVTVSAPFNFAPFNFAPLIFSLTAPFLFSRIYKNELSKTPEKEKQLRKFM